MNCKYEIDLTYMNKYLSKIDKYIIKCNNLLDKINNDISKSESNKIIHLEPPFTNICQFNCIKKAGYIKNGYYCCYFHIY
jgi:hypothetical protein